jgi:hypothetical protein
MTSGWGEACRGKQAGLETRCRTGVLPHAGYEGEFIWHRQISSFDERNYFERMKS